MNTRANALLIFLILIGLVSTAVAQPVIIDEFTTTQSTGGQVDGAGILGGERDATVQGGHTLDIGGGMATITRPTAPSFGFVILNWDGEDNTSVISHLLGPVDLTNGGKNDRFYFDVTQLTGTAQFLINAYSGPGNFVQLTTDITQPGILQLLFDSLPVGTNPPDMTAVTVITIRIILDVGETISFGPFYTGPGPIFFKDGFEEIVDP